MRIRAYLNNRCGTGFQPVETPAGCRRHTILGLALSRRFAIAALREAVSVTNVALAIALVGSAYLTATAVGSPTHAWMGWLSLLPLFVCIRVLHPLRASACGALWGGCLFAFCVAAGRTAVSANLASLALLTALPAIYTFLGAALTRWMGFSPFVLGVGWMGVELVLAPLGLHYGLLSASQGDTALMHYVGRALGYVLVAFLVAWVNATLVAVFARVRLRLPRPFRITTSGNGVLFLRSQIVGGLSLVTLRPSHPRAPPF